MFLLVVAAIITLTVPLARGRLQNLTKLRLRATWSVVVAFVLQIGITEVVEQGNTVLHAVTHIVSLGIGAIFLVANRRLFGIWLTALGAALNAVVVAVNGGVMPATVDAARRAGF